MKRVVLLRSNPVNPYPRLEKMANTLLKMGYYVTVLGWDRSENYDAVKSNLNLTNGKAEIIRVGIKSKFSAGIRSNLVPLLKFQSFIKKWLKKNRNCYDIIHAYDFDTGYISKGIAK